MAASNQYLKKKPLKNEPDKYERIKDKTMTKLA